jgi:hypothetical protein
MMWWAREQVELLRDPRKLDDFWARHKIGEALHGKHTKAQFVTSLPKWSFDESIETVAGVCTRLRKFSQDAPTTTALSNYWRQCKPRVAKVTSKLAKALPSIFSPMMEQCLARDLVAWMGAQSRPSEYAVREVSRTLESGERGHTVTMITGDVDELAVIATKVDNLKGHYGKHNVI